MSFKSSIPVVLTSLAMLLISTTANAEIIKKTLNTSDATLFKRMFVEKSVTMPQLKVFNSDGVLLYGTNTLDKALVKNVMKAVKETDKKGENELSKHLDGFKDDSGNSLKDDTFKSSNLIIVESYVEWFEGSQTHRKDLQQILASLSDQDVLWLELDVDPKKMKGANVSVTNID